MNLILFGLWVGIRHGRELGDEGFAAAADAAAELNGVIANVRALRRGLGNAADGGIRRLRGAALRLELAAERQAQERLAACAGVTSEPQTPCDRWSAALANLARCIGDESNSSEAAMLRRELAALTQRV